MSLLASIGLIVSSPVIGEVMILKDGELSPTKLSCEERIGLLANDPDSSVIADASDSKIVNEAPSECGLNNTVYATNLVHRDDRMVQQYSVTKTVLIIDTEDGE
ncbi:MAG: hypothetical protein AAGK66_10325 [Pseudomonadota bacterium]